MAKRVVRVWRVVVTVAVLQCCCAAAVWAEERLKGDADTGRECKARQGKAPHTAIELSCLNASARVNGVSALCLVVCV
jgi:hypothetical protein